jgi:hypothetical protein
MQFDQYGRPLNPSAVIAMPTLGQMGGDGVGGQPQWVRFPFFPTAPFYSTNPNIGTQTRFYSTGLLSSDTDFVALGAEVIRTITFDIPCRIIAINGSCVNTAALGALPVGVNPRDCFLFRAEYTTGDRLHVAARLGSTVLGTMDRPGELGGAGYTIDQGGSLILGITPINPIPANFRIDITLHAMEIRGSANFVGGR